MNINESAREERFLSLVEALPQCDDVTAQPSTDLTDDLIFGFLLWESSLPKATTAFEQLKSQLVDANEIRVCLPEDFATIIGPKYPRALERSRSIRSVFNDLFHRHNAVTLDHTRAMPPADFVQFLAQLDGMNRFVKAHLATIVHTAIIPVDALLIAALHHKKIIDAATARKRDRIAILEQWLGNLVPDQSHRQVHLQLRSWIAEVEPQLPVKKSKTTKAKASSTDDSDT